MNKHSLFFIFSNYFICVFIIIGVSLYYQAIFSGNIFTIDIHSYDSKFCRFYNNQVFFLALVALDWFFYKKLPKEAIKVSYTAFIAALFIIAIGYGAIIFAPVSVCNVI